jgi:hypothetical protein
VKYLIYYIPHILSSYSTLWVEIFRPGCDHITHPVEVDTGVLEDFFGDWR